MMSLFNNQTVSVIIPVYNAEKYIAYTLDSVLKQTYQDFEIILVDDCSNDSSGKIICSYKKVNDRIVYYRQSINQGAAVARNKALQLAKGRYVAFLDSDDAWYETKLERQLKFMKRNNCAISCTAMDTMDENGKKIRGTRNVHNVISYNFLLRNTMIATSTVIVDRNKTGSFEMPLRRGGQDYATWLMLLRKGDYCWGLNEVLTRYRILPNSLSSNKWKSVKQVWQIQRKEEHIAVLPAMFNVCCFVINAFIKHYIKI